MPSVAFPTLALLGFGRDCAILYSSFRSVWHTGPMSRWHGGWGIEAWGGGRMTINDKRRGMAGADRHCGDLRKPEGLSGRWAGARRRSCRSPGHLDRTRGVCHPRWLIASNGGNRASLEQISERQNSRCQSTGLDRKGWPDNFRIGSRLDRSWHRWGRELRIRADQPASFRINFVMRKPSERPAVYGSGCEGVSEAINDMPCTTVG